MGVVAGVLAGDVDGDVVGGGEVGVGEDGVGFAGGDDGARGGEQEDVVGIGEEFFEVVGDGDHRRAVRFFVEAGEGGEDGFARGEIEAGGGFVEDEQFRVADEGAGDEAAHALAGGEGEVALRGLCGEADLREEVAGVFPLVGRGVDVADGEGGEVAGDDDIEGGHGVIEGVDRGGFDNAHAGAERSDGGVAEGLAEEMDGPFLRPEVGAGDAEERGLSAAVGTEDGGDLPGGDGPGDVGEDGARGVAVGAGEVDVIQ